MPLSLTKEGSPLFPHISPALAQAAKQEMVLRHTPRLSAASRMIRTAFNAKFAILLNNEQLTTLFFRLDKNNLSLCQTGVVLPLAAIETAYLTRVVADPKVAFSFATGYEPASGFGQLVLTLVPPIRAIIDREPEPLNPIFDLIVGNVPANEHLLVGVDICQQSLEYILNLLPPDVFP